MIAFLRHKQYWAVSKSAWRRQRGRGGSDAGGASPAVLDGLQLVKLVTIQAVSRGSAARRSHRKRSQVAQELLLTERSYYQGLRTLIDVYLSPLTQLSNAGHDAEIPAAQRRAIFGEVAALASVFDEVQTAHGGLYTGSTSPSPTACESGGHGRAGTQNDRLGEAVILRTGTHVPAQ